MKKIPLILMIFVSFLLAALSVFPQSPTATLTGVVTDLNDAVVQGATVTVTNKATNFARTSTTNDNGVYVISSLPVGEYKVKTEAAGFQPINADVILNIGQTLSFNQSLEVGQGGHPTEVYIYGEGVDTQTSKVDAVINDKEIENLPLNGRNFLELALLTPGNTVAPNFDPTKTNTVLISSAGQIGRGGNVMIDGTDNNDDVVGGSLVNVSQDAVQEFQVTTNRFSAEFGRSGSSIINVVTKSGTNDLRGSFSFFHRDKSLQGLPATFDRSQPTPPFDRQQYAFTIGGPIVKDKFFAFGAVEFRDQEGGIQVGRRDLPTRTILREFFPAPSRDTLVNTRFDYVP